MVVFASGNSISRAPLNPWRKPLRLSCRARRPGPGLRMPTRRGQGHMVLWQQFPEAKTTKWSRGSTVPVAFLAIWHGGGYTYRLCKMPVEGKTGLTEECFTKNVLKFADNKTFWRRTGIEHRNDEWEGLETWDATIGTYPEGSAWRQEKPYKEYALIFKDHVVVPEGLEPGLYVLGWRWDAKSGSQVWVSCANIEII